MKNVLRKINNVQKEIESIKKNAENPFYKTNYADLGNIQEHLQVYLEANQLMIMHTVEDGKLKTFVYDLESAESVHSEIEITMTDPQKKGSEITYFRRYNLVCLFDLKIEDDDANKTAPKQKEVENKIDIWLTDKQFEATKQLPKERIAACLVMYNGLKKPDGKTYGMKKDYRTQLEALIEKG